MNRRAGWNVGVRGGVAEANRDLRVAVYESIGNQQRPPQARSETKRITRRQSTIGHDLGDQGLNAGLILVPQVEYEHGRAVLVFDAQTARELSPPKLKNFGPTGALARLPLESEVVGVGLTSGRESEAMRRVEMGGGGIFTGKGIRFDKKVFRGDGLLDRLGL